MLRSFASFKKFLQRPHPFIFNRSSLIIPFVCTFLIIGIFRPFEFKSLPNPELFIAAAAFGFIAALCVWLTTTALNRFLPTIFHEDSWTIGKEFTLIFLVIFLISVVIFSVILWIGKGQNVSVLFNAVVLRTILISIFPVIVLVLYEQYSHQKTKYEEAQKLNNDLHKRDVSFKNTEGGEIHLKSENDQTALRLSASKIMYVKSEGNYLEVFYKNHGEVKKELIRNRLKSVEELLPTANFLRCHKSYIVNMDYVMKVEGSARNLTLHLTDIEGQLPVSRTYAAIITRWISE